MNQQVKIKKQKSINSSKKYDHVNLSLHDLEEKIKNETIGLEGDVLGEKKLAIIRPIALDFLIKVNDARNQDLEATMSVLQHTFRMWIKQQSGIQNAYQLLLDNDLLRDEDRKTPMLYQLEFIMGNGIHFISRHSVSENIAPAKKKREKVSAAIRRLRTALSDFKGLYCYVEAKQHLLQCLLDDIVSDQEKNVRSPHSSGTSRALTRAILTSKIIEQLRVTFSKKSPEARVIAKTALEMTSIFFAPRDVSDTTDDARTIQSNVLQNENFVRQTICNYLQQSFED